MGTAPAEDYAPIAEAWDFSRATVVADLGGGGGSLILAVLGLNSHLQCMLVDCEASLDAAKSRFADEDLSSRCELIAADLTQSVPTGADVYMLKHVLHGYRDAEAVTVLRNCRAVIPQNGSLLVIEFVLPPLVSHSDPQLEGRLMSDLNMLAVTGGRERSEREWRALLEAAGFILTRVCPVGGRHSYGSERRDSRSEASSGMSPSCSERWTVLFGMTSTQRCSRHVRRSACAPTQKSQNVVFDDSQIASTPIECGEGFQISGCWWVTCHSDRIVTDVAVLLRKRYCQSLCQRNEPFRNGISVTLTFYWKSSIFT
jgi:hypothetical protein